MTYFVESRTCLDSNPKKFEVTYDGGSAGIQKVKLCKQCFQKPVFKKFIIKVKKIKC